MKKFESYIIIGLAALALSSCDRFLSTEPLDIKAYDAIDWTDQGNIDEHLYDILDDWVDLRSYFYMDALTDIAYCNDATLGFRTIGLGYATPVNPGYNFYDYSKIIKCNRFLKEFDANKEVLKEWLLEKYGNEGGGFRICDIPLQARFVRAWCYLKMLCLYGEVPLILEDTPEGAAVPVASRKEIVDFLVEEADFFLGEAWKLLPNNWRETTYKDAFPYHRGWVNKYGGAMLGLRILMYAAAYYDNDTQIWKKVADFAGEFLKLVESGKTEFGLPEIDFAKARPGFEDAVVLNGMSIFQLAYFNTAKYAEPSYPNGVLQEYALTPEECASKLNLGAFYPAVDGGSCSCVPTLRLFQAFYMANGIPIEDPMSGFDKTHPLKDRERLMAETLLFPYSVWKDGRYNSLDRTAERRGDSTRTVTGNPDYFAASVKSSKTAFAWRKFIDPTVPPKEASMTRIPVFRLAELYLIYAEACGWAGGAKYKGGEFNRTAADAVNTLNEMWAVGNVDPGYASDQMKFLGLIRDFRIREFAGEGLRCFDLARYGYDDRTKAEVEKALGRPVQRFSCVTNGQCDWPWRTRTYIFDYREGPVWWADRKLSREDYDNQCEYEVSDLAGVIVEEKHFPDPTFFSIPIPQAAYDANPALYDVD